MPESNPENGGAFRQALSPEGGSWNEMLKELEPGPEEETHRAIPIEKTEPAAANPPVMSRYEQLCKLPSMQMERGDMDVMLEFSEIISKVNATGRLLTKLRENHPYALPPHIMQTLRDNLKETSTVMLRELHIMRNGREKKKYEKRFVCKCCHSVFMVPLPGDGICDECRADMTPRAGPY